MSVRENVEITKAARLADGVFEMWLKTEIIARESKPGQFISVYSNDGSRLLPRPISICRIDEDLLRIVYRVAGKGTLEFSQMKEGERLNIQGPLGNGYDLPAIFEQVENVTGKKPEKAILFGGGIGVPPMLELAKAISEKTDCKAQAVMGYRDSQMFLKEEFESYADVTVATEDGSAGVKGNVLDAVKECNITGDVIFACGPAPMLRAVKAYAAGQGIEAYVSLEEKMACGIGACLACVCKSTEKDGHSQVHNKRVCKEGPVFNAKEVEI
ncbi:MAG: dihydroorotate dehydrogenase electron transfer subunit [Eubacteriales bacterium]|nr:dihydroorotate dehydrogenase electron transfer subunit [Eubacteriales bacterium]